MFDILKIIHILCTANEYIKEKTEPVAPKGTRFDWDAYWKDVKNGMTCMEQVKKRQNGDYMTINPLPQKPIIPKWYEVPTDTVIDTKRYEHDKELYGEEIVEVWRKHGSYRYVKEIAKIEKR